MTYEMMIDMLETATTGDEILQALDAVVSASNTEDEDD